MENDMMAIVMAAGKGTRMKSKSSKLVQKIYPEKAVESYILWTNETRLMRVR